MCRLVERKNKYAGARDFCNVQTNRASPESMLKKAFSGLELSKVFFCVNIQICFPYIKVQNARKKTGTPKGSPAQSNKIDTKLKTDT